MTPEDDIFEVLDIFGDDPLGLVPQMEEIKAQQRAKQKAKLDSLLAELRDSDWEPRLTEASYCAILATGLRSKNLVLAAVAAEIALNENPLTLRGLFYLVVSAGVLPSTDKKHYGRLGRVMTALREKSVIPFNWIVDNLRSTLKPSSWSGLGEFTDTVRDAYRKDFWANLNNYVHILCEKDAIAGTLSPVTQEFDVALSPIRGYSSLSYAHAIAAEWNEIEKPIYAYYLGDYDPSGFDLERDIRQKLARYCHVDFHWRRLGVNHEDFAAFDLLPLDPKKSDKRYKAFVEIYGYKCAELDAIPATELRQRVREAIKQHIPEDEWARLRQVEAAEKETVDKFLAGMRGVE